MGERKGVNKYYPPDYDPSKGGLNKSQGTHALRERAKKLHLGILIIRFEMPYNIWCEGCGNHIGTGVRYNAEKKKVGMYYTTPVYEFRMKCHLCDNYFEIRTDPANLDYVITSGARRQERRWDPEENDQIAAQDKELTRKIAVDAMFKLERGKDDKLKASALGANIEELKDLQDSRWEDNFSANRLLRQRFRNKEKELKAQEAIDASYNLSVPLLPPSDDDARAAALLPLTMKTAEEESLKRRQEVDARGIFSKVKVKKLSNDVKKDIAKQSISNIVAASSPNFNSTGNIFSKQLKNLVKVKPKNKSKVITNGNRIEAIESNLTQCSSTTINVSSPESHSPSVNKIGNNITDNSIMKVNEVEASSGDTPQQCLTSKDINTSRSSASTSQVSSLALLSQYSESDSSDMDS